MTLQHSNFTTSTSPPPASGAAMDVRVAKRPRRWPLIGAAVAAGVALLCWTTWNFMPHGLVVKASDLNLAEVKRGIYRDDISVRASAQALQSIILDSVDRGRVEAVFVKDGSLVKQGDLLFRLSNPQRRMELLERQSEQAQQISNLSSFRVNFENARSDSRRRVIQMEYDLNEAVKQQERNDQLFERGFISRGTRQDGVDKIARLRAGLHEAVSHQEEEIRTQREAVSKLEHAINDMRSGLQLFNESIDALAVRAPGAGVLTDFNLQVGEAVKVDQRLGRIDQPDNFKLVAQVDEFYLPRMATGYHGTANVDGKPYTVVIKTIVPQVKNGRFAVDLLFTGAQPPGLRAGLSVDLGIILGEPAPALMLPNGAYLDDTGGAWVFVVNADCTRAERRAVRIGRRNNGQVEVLGGLVSGDRVIVSSYASLGKSERLQIEQ